MRIFISLLLIMSSIFIGKMISEPNEKMTSAQEVAPQYAKWGRMAMQKTMEKYQNVNIIDYLHIGREVGKSTSTEKFKLWIRDGEREFGVFIDITFKNDTEEVLSIQFEETDR